MAIRGGFGRWRRAPPLWYWFTRMQQRAPHLLLPCAFAFDEKGYQEFARAIGPIPEGMRSPTVGRYDHEQGYVYDRDKKRWNFRWQEKAENSSESAVRSNFGQFGNRRSASSPRRNSLQIVVCPHCKLSGRLPPMRRWHFDRCKMAITFKD
jgi:hypothetical protein